MKSPFNSDCESIELIERERSNYLNIRFPFIVKYFGYIEQGNIKCLLLEFVEGKTLKNYDTYQLSYREKCNVIFELILTVQYIHSFGYICRDMHLENIIINENKDAVLIDFDRVIKIEEQKTKDFALIDLPELELDENLTYKSDICLLGYVSYYILIGEKPRPIKQHELIYDLNDFPKKFLNEKLLFESCFYKNPEKRPDMNQMFRLLYHHFLSSIQEQGRKEQDLLNVFESNSLIINDNALFLIVGIIYYEDKYVKRNVDKTIHYYLLAANQNYAKAQFNLGVIYQHSDYVTKDIGKAIHYYTLAANQNEPISQFNLAVIYYFGDYVTKDIGKAIHYYTLAANQNYVDAQYSLGNIYYSGEYVDQDIDKAIHYYTLAANHNYPKALCRLGLFYYGGEYVDQDIGKAIRYFTLAAKLNYSLAQVLLGRIYYEGEYVKQNISKALYYLTLAANQNDREGQYWLASIYYEGLYGNSLFQRSVML